MNAEIVNVHVRREMDGYFVATSDELPGLVLAHKDMTTLIKEVTPAIIALYKADLGIDVQVVEAFPAFAEEITLPPAWVITRPPTSAMTQ